MSIVLLDDSTVSVRWWYSSTSWSLSTTSFVHIILFRKQEQSCLFQSIVLLLLLHSKLETVIAQFTFRSCAESSTQRECPTPMVLQRIQGRSTTWPTIRRSWHPVLVGGRRIGSTKWRRRWGIQETRVRGDRMASWTWVVPRLSMEGIRLPSTWSRRIRRRWQSPLDRQRLGERRCCWRGPEGQMTKWRIQKGRERWKKAWPWWDMNVTRMVGGGVESGGAFVLVNNSIRKKNQVAIDR